MRAISLALLFACSCAPPPPASTRAPAAEGDASRLARFDAQVGQIHERLKIPGLSVAVVRDRRVVWARGYGWADVERRIAATPETPYPAASLTKPFTSTLVLRLVEAGRLSLDEPAARYSAQFAGSAATVRHVLSMTSADPPGQRYEYDGNRYMGLDSVLLEVDGRSSRELLARELLEPLGMSSSAPGLDVADSASALAAVFGEAAVERWRGVLARMAVPYRLWAGEETVRAPYPPREFDGAAGLVSTVLDLARFDSALGGETLLSPEMRSRAWTPAVAPDGRVLPYALGWFSQEYRGTRLVWHYGYWPGAFSGLIVKAPEKGVTLIALANSDALSAGFYRTDGVETNPLACTFHRLFVVEDSLRRRLPDPGWRAGAAGIDPSSSAAAGYDYGCERLSLASIAAREEGLRAERREVAAVDPAEYTPLAGRYRFEDGWEVTILRDGARLLWRSRSGEYELFPASRRVFFFKAVPREVEFVADGGDAAITGLIVRVEGQQASARRVPGG
jgi:CubicO group peptidase (beta-lactamase class C family)